MDEVTTKTIKELFFEFKTDEISNKFKFEVEYRDNVKLFKVNASLDFIVKNLKYFQYLGIEQVCIIYTTIGLPKLEQKFEVKEVWITATDLMFVCKVKPGERLKHKEKNVNKFRAFLKRQYGVKCEVEIED